MAKWWQCVLMIAFSLAFGWVIREGLQTATKEGIWSHVLIPLYGVWLYATLSVLLNRRSLIVTRERFVLANGPIPVRAIEVIPREQIAFCYFHSVMVVSDSGSDSYPIEFETGIQTTDGRHINTYGEFKSVTEARDSAIEMARALNHGNKRPMVEVRELGNLKWDPVERRRMWFYAAICGVALLAGIVWEIVFRSC